MSEIRPEDVLLAAAVYGGVVLAAFWLAMVIWAFRDMRARSRDGLARLLVAVLVAVLTVPGLLIYLLLRPRETLVEAYERSLEEEALLQGIEEKPACPSCGQRVQEDWQVCPYCHTRLKKPCVNCRQPLEMAWNLCPYCAAPQMSYRTGVDDALNITTHEQPLVRSSRVMRSSRAYRASTSQPLQTGASSGSVEFVEGDEL